LATLVEIEARYEFSLPDEFIALHQHVLSEVDRTDDSPARLLGVRWLTLAEMGTYPFEEFRPGGFVPFAQSAEGDLWCWYTPLTAAAGVPIVRCPHDDSVASLAAPHLAAWLYAQLLTECCFEIDRHGEVESRQRVGEWLRRVRDFLPADWAGTVQEVLARPLQKWAGVPYETESPLVPSELENTLQRDLAYPDRNRRIPWVSS
jgi:hypothetical protein